MSMPGHSRELPLPPLTADETAAQGRLQADLLALAGDIGERHMALPRELERAALLIEQRLVATGYKPLRRPYQIDGATCSNIEVTLPGRTDELVVVGAHYDSARGSPGANDNGSGVVALLELGRRLRGFQADRGVALVFFVNEEPPYFNTDKMGSRVWAKEAHERGARITAALSLETMGYYTDAHGSQQYPPPIGAFYPDQGNFLGFVGNNGSMGLVRDTVRLFREVGTLPSDGAALPAFLPGVDWSDHASFWPYGWSGVMVTDTAPFRYPHYHTGNDTPDKVDTASLARAVLGVEHVVRSLATSR